MYVLGSLPPEHLSHHQISNYSAVPTLTQPDAVNIVLFCGSPGAGKSSYYWRVLQPLGYGRVNQDILKTVSVKRYSTCIAASCCVITPLIE
jgi:predicted GTPase